MTTNNPGNPQYIAASHKAVQTPVAGRPKSSIGWLSNSQSATPGTERKITVHQEVLDLNPNIRSFYNALFGFTNDDDKIQLLIIPSHRLTNGVLSDVVQYKMLGGKDDGKMETRFGAFRREFCQEGQSKYGKFSLQEEMCEMYHQEDWDDQVWGKPYIHRRFFWYLPFSTEKTFKGTSQLRKAPIWDYDLNKGLEVPENQRCGELLLTPTFLDIEVLARKLIYFSHIKALAAGILKLAENPVAFDLLPDGILEWAESKPTQHFRK